jgi:hypothetical protein
MNLQAMTRLELEALHAVTLKHIDSVEHNNADEGASVDTFEQQQMKLQVVYCTEENGEDCQPSRNQYG